MPRGERRRIQGRAAVRARGFTYVWALMAVALLGLVLARVGPAFAQSVQREREAQLLRVGVAYAVAIERYYHAHPSKQYPARLDQLLLDSRFAAPVRHLRDLYLDPVNPGQALEPIGDAGGRVIGVRSRSEAKPVRTQAWTDGRHDLPGVQRYSDWKFVARVDG